MTQEQADHIEYTYNVFVDAETEQYNHNNHDAETGWMAIPEAWKEA